MTKNAIRLVVRKRLQELSQEDLNRQSCKIQQHLLASGLLDLFEAIGLYASMKDEVALNVAEIMAKITGNRTFLLPRYNAQNDSYDMVEILDYVKDTVVGKYEIPEPGGKLPIRQLDEQTLIVVPGRAFTRCGIRLGRGKAYYDRLLTNSNTVKVGVCWNEQVFSELPCDERDIRMDYLLTPQGLLKCDNS